METVLLPSTQSKSLSRTTWAAQLRALGAIIWREYLHFVRYPTWIIAFIIWPILFPATYIFSSFALAGPGGSGVARFLEVAGTENFLGYIVVGTTVWMWANTMLWNVGFALRGEQMRGTLESNWMTPTSHFFFLLGSGPVHAASTLMFFLFTVVEFRLFFHLTFDANLLSLLAVFVAALPALYGLGFTFASLVITAREANTFVFLVRGIVMIFCGITYPLTVMPQWMQAVAEWLPSTLIIRAARLAALNHAPLEAVSRDLLLLLAYGAFWLALGYLTFSQIERRARLKGALNQY
ncbi:ABC transporter permease [Anaerolinea sp.]|uniref:ABC transporter permease n=1 Tax=Anaerolinea sp. TaxID=1872519 RepID=UPI002ACE03ED|nr:ABC transporter permease [Anaerolinea sp.]